MIKLTELEKKLLHSNREIKIRYDLLDYEENKIGELTAKDGQIQMNSLSQVKRTGSLTIKETEFRDINWLTEKVQPFFMIRNNDSWIEWSLGIFLISSPNRIVKNSSFRQVDLYDKNLVLLEDKVDSRYLIKPGANYIDLITKILNEIGIWKIKFPEFFAGETNTEKEFEIGTDKLTIINSLLSEINFNSMWVDEYGNYRTEEYLIPGSRNHDYEYKDNEISVIVKDSAMEELDLFGVANKFIVVASNPEKEPLTSIYINDNPYSLTSTINRKRIITDFREINDILDQETLDKYTERIAYESSKVFGKFVFETAIMPHHSNSDALYCEYKKLGIANKYIETAWSMELKAGGKMRHNARRVIEI